MILKLDYFFKRFDMKHYFEHPFAVDVLKTGLTGPVLIANLSVLK